MTTPAVPVQMTADEFLEWDHGGFELVDGCVEENPMGSLSSWLGGELYSRLTEFAKASRTGVAFPQETGIAVWPDRVNYVRKPDAMFIRRDRLPGGKLPIGWLSVSPDLVAEVVSPGERAEKLNAKLEDYRLAAIPLIWVIYPGTRTALEYRSDRLTFIDTDGVLDGGDVVPGFSLRLASLFEAAGDLI
jgi:Uma2 family endonuclease